MNFLLICGSLRTGSLNKKLLVEINTLLSEHSAYATEVVDLKKLSIPVYDGDIEAQGIPHGVIELGKMISHADGIIISSPEYNSSIAGPLKNTIDWVSRIRPNPWAGKAILLTGASPGAFGSIRGLSATRAPLDALSSYVYPQTFALPLAGDAFLPTGDLASEVTKKKLAGLLENFSEFAEKFKTSKS